MDRKVLGLTALSAVVVAVGCVTTWTVDVQAPMKQFAPIAASLLNAIRQFCIQAGAIIYLLTLSLGTRPSFALGSPWGGC